MYNMSISAVQATPGEGGVSVMRSAYSFGGLPPVYSLSQLALVDIENVTTSNLEGLEVAS
jgi:hypothetical protein